MPIRLDVHEGGALVVLTAIGVVSEPEFVKVHQRFLRDPGNVGRLREWLSDWTATDALEISTNAIREIAELAVDAVRATDHPGKVVVLVAGELVDRLAILWQAFTDETGWPTLVTRDRAEALVWLGRDRLPTLPTT